MSELSPPTVDAAVFDSVERGLLIIEGKTGSYDVAGGAYAS